MLPLVADCSYEGKSIGDKEIVNAGIGNVAGLFLLRLPDGESIWFNAENTDEEKLYQTLENQLKAHLGG